MQGALRQAPPKPEIKKQLGKPACACVCPIFQGLQETPEWEQGTRIPPRTAVLALTSPKRCWSSTLRCAQRRCHTSILSQSPMFYGWGQSCLASTARSGPSNIISSDANTPHSPPCTEDTIRSEQWNHRDTETQALVHAGPKQRHSYINSSLHQMCRFRSSVVANQHSKVVM